LAHRAEQVEHRRDADLASGRSDVPHCGVERRREAEPDPGLGHTPGDDGGRGVDADAERLEDVGRPACGRRRPVPVLAAPSTGPGHDERGDRRHVDRV